MQWCESLSVSSKYICLGEAETGHVRCCHSVSTPLCVRNLGSLDFRCFEHLSWWAKMGYCTAKHMTFLSSARTQPPFKITPPWPESLEPILDKHWPLYSTWLGDKGDMAGLEGDDHQKPAYQPAFNIFIEGKNCEWDKAYEVLRSTSEDRRQGKDTVGSLEKKYHGKATDAKLNVLR